MAATFQESVFGEKAAGRRNFLRVFKFNSKFSRDIKFKRNKIGQCSVNRIDY